MRVVARHTALMLELTESVPLRLAERISADLMDLKAIGVTPVVETLAENVSETSTTDSQAPLIIEKLQAAFGGS